MKNLPSDYVIQKFKQLTPKAHHIRATNSYRGCCPVCKEGDSYGKKTRLNYYVDSNTLVCYNCSKKWRPLQWIRECSGMTEDEIIKEAQLSDHIITNNKVNLVENQQKPKYIPDLPRNSINLTDEVQVKYYSDKQVVRDALTVIKERRLDTLINKPKTLYVSLTDFVHKNRLCIPFYDSNNKITFYQTRLIYNEPTAKYLSKQHSEKTIYGINNIDPNCDYLFIFEGPIDACSMKNGISLAGIQTSDKQKELLNKYLLFNKIWILDNQYDNVDVVKKNMQLINNGETIFIWPQTCSEYKDFNDICTKNKLDKISPEFVIKNSYSGLEAKDKIKELSKIKVS